MINMGLLSHQKDMDAVESKKRSLYLESWSVVFSGHSKVLFYDMDCNEKQDAHRG